VRAADGLPRLDGTVAIVTGASRGIGAGLAVGLADAGASVVCAARTETVSPDGLPGTIHTTVDAISARGGKAVAQRCDIGSDGDIGALIDAAVGNFGGLDVLVNNAMTEVRAQFVDSTPEQWDESMRVNVRSLYTTAKAAMTPMIDRGGGSIINVSSGAADPNIPSGMMPPGYFIYSVAKAAMEKFSTALASELEPFNIAINALRPGAVKTEHAARELGDDWDWTGWMEPEAVVPAVLYLAVQRADGLTGRIVDSTQFGRTWP
jgi:NAD(P)-dependent dehydrogenase (short-subunit alcohol dehydrogenase family)